MTTRQTTIVLEVNDKFSAALNNFSAGVQKGTDALKGMSGAAGPAATVTDNAGRKIEDMGRKSEVMGDKLTRAFGGSSRAVNVFGNSITSALGVTGPMSYALDVLIDGGAKAALTFGALTLATTAIGAGVKIATDAIDRMQKVQATAIDQQTKIIAISLAQNVSLEEATRLYLALTPTLVEDAKAQAELAQKIIYAKEAEEAFLNVAKELQGTPIQQMALAAARAEYEHAQQVLLTARAYDQLRKNREAAYTAVPNLHLGGSIYSPFAKPDLDTSHDMSLVNPQEWQSQYDTYGRSRDKQAEDAANAARGRANEQASILRQFQNQAASIYRNIASDGEVTAKELQRSFTDAFAGIIEAQAQLNNNSSISLIGLQQNFSEVFANLSQDTVAKLLTIMDAGGEMAQSLISQLYQIAAAGGSATDMANALTDAINRVPTNKVINIRYNVTGGGPRYGQRNPQATNWGDEWWFDLGGEGYAVQQDWFNRYGNYDIANEEWKKAHRDELANRADNPQTGPQSPEPKAFGMHSVVTGPKLMMVGERGPERVDITPGTGARMGGGGGGVAVTINSLVPPNEFEVQQLAMRLKRYMRN